MKGIKLFASNAAKRAVAKSVYRSEQEDKFENINHGPPLDQIAFESAWNRYRKTPADTNDEKCQRLFEAIRAYMTVKYP